jgi:hypothetical protein
MKRVVAVLLFLVPACADFEPQVGPLASTGGEGGVDCGASNQAGEYADGGSSDPHSDEPCSPPDGGPHVAHESDAGEYK